MRLALLCLIAPAWFAGPAPSSLEPNPSGPLIPHHGVVMKQHAQGAFDVKVQPLEAYNKNPDAGLGRMSIDKQFHGELDASSQGEMLYAGNSKDTGGYVAVERVIGTLHGRRGAFSLQHHATRTPGQAQLDIIVVPGSGSGELAGLGGTMKIRIAEGGAHYYEFDYELAE